MKINKKSSSYNMELPIPLLLIIRIIYIVLLLYSIILLAELFTTDKTNGIIEKYQENSKKEKYYLPSKYKGYSTLEAHVYESEIKYSYLLGTKQYKGSVISHMIIYPEPYLNEGETTVYYCRYFPSISMLCPVTLRYVFYNSIVLIIISLIIIVKKIHRN